MKKITLLFFIFISFLEGNAQLINESFESFPAFPPTNWARFRTGTGSTFQWANTSGGSGGPTSYYAIAALESSGSGINTKYLVTPLLTPSATNNILRFKSKRSGISAAFATLTIRISTVTQNTATDFSTTVKTITEGTVASETVINTTLNDYTVDLSAYIGQNIYVAFVWSGNIFDGNNVYIDDVKDIPLSVLSIDDFNNRQFFNVFPNPTTNNLNITFSELTSNKINIKLFDLIGKCVFESTNKINTLETNLQLPNLEKGIYMLQISEGNNNQTKQIVIE